MIDPKEEHKKIFERKIAQVVSAADQYWELVKDKVDGLERIRNKLSQPGAVKLDKDESKTIFLVLNLVIAEARLRKTLTTRS